MHIPFCFHKCHYCDFYSLVDQGDREGAFVDRLLAELNCWTSRDVVQPKTIFVGGGTPTLMSVPAWRRVLGALRQTHTLANVKEFTVEANPETVTPDLLDVLKDGGVNRLSIGAQSFDPLLLKALERWHDPANVARAVELARDSGIDNINLDLIFAIPGQTTVQLEADLDAALALKPDHLSCYSLIFEPGTPLFQRRRQGAVQQIDDEVERAYYARVMQRLAEAGYEHYEISNWARPGRRCAHNLTYWHNDNWIGLGPSAASHLDGRRWKNVPHLGEYLKSPATDPAPVTEDETLAPDQSVGEQLMLRLRLNEGVRHDWLDRHAPQGDARREEMARLLALGLLAQTPTHVRLSDEGRFLADSVLAALL